MIKMIENKDYITHAGIVSKISSDNIEISLEGNFHCEACNAKTACGVSESTAKIVEIDKDERSFEINESVNVIMQKSLGLKAVFWGYIFPFILLFSVLMIASTFLEEWVAGLLSLFILLPYYLLLYFNKKLLKKAFTISVYKNN